VEAIARQMETEVRRIEAKYSRYQPDSVLSRINRHAGQRISIDAETAYLVNYARACFEQSDGLFDISSGILRSAWDFRNPRLPGAAELNILQRRIGLDRLQLHQHALIMPPDMELDLGGIGKEYAADAAAAIARHHGIRSGIIDLGGDLHILGPKITAAGSTAQPWMLGVRHPRRPHEAIAQLPVYQGGMATSGDYERCFELAGKRYCHLLNPLTGWPVSHWASVTVLAPSCMLAGTLASIAMLREAAAADWLREQDVHALLIRPDLKTESMTPAD